MIEHNWMGLYKEGWGSSIIQAAYSHPAKFRPALIRRIYAHLLEQGYLQVGQVVLDPFAGVALGALHAMQNGLIWLGVELEERFVTIGQQNIDLWNKRYSTMPGWGRAICLQGDSRRLCEVLATAGFAGAVSSPPFIGIVATQDPNFLTPGEQGKRIPSKSNSPNYGTSDGQLASLPEGDAPQVPQAGAVVSSMPYAGSAVTSDGQRGIGAGSIKATAEKRRGQRRVSPDGYGTTLANLGNLPAGEPPAAAVVGSPPYTASLASDDPDKRGGLFRDPRRRGDRTLTAEYGVSEGQIGAMREGEPPAAVVSSPPWESSIGNAADSPDVKTIRPVLPEAQGVAKYLKEKRLEKGLSQREVDEYLGTVTLYSWYEGRPAGTQIPTASHWLQLKQLLNLDDRFDVGILTEVKVRATGKDTTGSTGHKRMTDYGQSDGQLGTESGTTFWSASAEIMRQVYQVLAPGGYTAWVCKRFVRAGTIVQFSQQWAALGESCGFETIEWIRCWVVDDRGAQHALDGGLVHKQVSHKSFFRRNNEKKGAPPIDFEIVIIQRKPLPGDGGNGRHP